MSTVVLERFAYAPDGTFGRLLFPGGKVFFTVELPWLSNQNDVSCIPEGTYQLIKRHSPVVKRTSRGEFEEGWEVTNVPGRTFIMLHVANWPFNVQGCIGVGKDYSIIPDRTGVPRNGVTDSVNAFREMMELMETRNEWVLDIRPKFIEYP